jgi:hydroxymethylpyrimidine/phosphomethylpyrimidine kinase
VSARQTRPGARAAVLTIAGLDPTAGAGGVADALRIAREGAHPLVVISALTEQTTRGVASMHPVDPQRFAAQIAALAADVRIRAAKTGLLPSAAHVAAVARAAARDFPKNTPLVVDPVLASSGGFPFLDARGIAALKRELIPRAAVVTPNLPELARLTSLPTNTPDQILAAARALLDLGARAVLVKGGHGAGPTVTDRLVDRDGVAEFRARRIPIAAHGTGCALAAVLAARLALGDSIRDAAAAAIRRVRGDLRRARPLGGGAAILGL